MATTKTRGRRRHRSRAAAARGRRGGEAAKRRGAGILKPVVPDEVLARVVGTTPQPRSEMTRRLWRYIKAHELQDPSDGRVIRPDQPLRHVLGEKRRVSMFEIPRHLNAHLR